MKQAASVRVGRSALSGLLIAGSTFLPQLATSARAQAGGMAGIGQSDTLTIHATVQAVDLQTRTVKLVGPQGNVLELKVSDEVRNLPQVKPGDTVNARYHASVAYVLAPPGTKLPDNSEYGTSAQAAPGKTPAGVAGAKLIITGTVVGVDPAGHTLQLVNPSGGSIRTVAVVTPEGQRNMSMIKVGDTITAVITEAVAISVEPAS